MAKKWKAIVLAVIVLLVSIKEFVPNEVYAANTIIKVSSQADLKKISKNMFGHYKLSKDIVISEKEWNSIGLSKTNGVAFQGILDGNGHTISGLSSKKGNGLFYEVGKFGTVKNLTLEGKVSASDSDGCAILTRSNSGYLYQVKVKGTVEGKTASCLAGITIANSGKIEKCVNESKVIHNFSTSKDTYYLAVNVGGICASNSGTILSCKNKGEILAKEYQVGGIAGANSTGCLIYNCENQASVNGVHSGMVGGIVGWNYGMVNSCKNRGEISVHFEPDMSRTQVGGIVGQIAGSGNVLKCLNDGTVSSGSFTGGIVGNINLRLFVDSGDVEQWINGGPIVADCTNNGQIYSIDEENISFMPSVGGVVGGIESARAGAEKSANSIQIIRCKNNADLSNTGATYVYGILGSLYNSVPVTIESCINYGDIVLKQDWDSAAGISTYPDEFVTIKKCANYGTITAGTAYGICDSMGSMTDTCPPTSATIEDCANYGDISSNYFSAGITGRIGVMKRCINLGHITATYNAAPEGKNDSVRSIAYYVEHKSGLYYLVGDLAESNGIDEVVGAPLTLQEFSSQSNLKEFDFKTVWTMGKVNDNTVPVLGVPTEKTQALLDTGKLDVAKKQGKIKVKQGSFRTFASKDARVCLVSDEGEIIPVSKGKTKILGVTTDGFVVETTITITEKTHIYNTFDIYEKFQWSKDGKKCVISDMLCQSCGKRQTLNCKVKEHILTKPTYYSKGYARYDATITIHGEEYSSQKYVELAKKKRKD